MGTELVCIEQLTITFPNKDKRIPVVDNVSFSIEAGQTLALVGESGSGKSMSALGIMRLIPKPGQIEANTRINFDDRDLLKLSVPEIRKVRGGDIAMIFQEPMTSLNPVVSVGRQVVEAIQLHDGLSRKDARARAEELFAMVGIPDPEKRFFAYPHQLSGGLKQRVMIAMAMAMQPRLLIADEPTTALDVTVQAQILDLLRQLASQNGTAILLITHDFGVVNEVADRVAVMYAGKLVEQGTRGELMKSPRHPYTKGLLDSIPSSHTSSDRLNEIPGVVPRPGEWPSGCRFASRCSYSFAPCQNTPPKSVTISTTHSASCHKVEEELQQ